MKYFFNFLILLTCIFFVCNCSNKKEKNDTDFIAKVGTNTLTVNDLKDIYAAASNMKDSAIFIKNYLEKWASDELLYTRAQKVLGNDKEIEKLVSEYRKSLIINSFKRKILYDNNIKPTKEDINKYYEQNKSKLKLDEPILKGALLQVAKNSPKIDQLRAAMRKMDKPSIEKIEKYSLQYAINYDFFTDKWLSLSDIMQRIPIPQSNKDAFVSSRNFYELQDSLSIYFLTIKEFKVSGTETPLEHVTDLITNILTNQKSLQFVKDYQKKLYDNAVKKGEVVIK